MTTDPERAGDKSDMESVEDDDNNTSEFTSQILHAPDVLAALRARFPDPRLKVFKFNIVNYKNNN